MFDLHDFRQNVLKMTQIEFADLIGVRQDSVSRMEKNPETIDLTMLMKIANATGQSLDELVGYKKTVPQALDVEDTWETNGFMKKTFLEYLTSRIKELNLTKKEYSLIYKELEEMIQNTLRKPTVAVVGMSDAGKSRLINALLGMDKMPTSWTPTTSISVHIKHIKDRPSFIKDETWVFEGGKKGFDIDRIYHKEYCEESKLASGPASILSEYGTRQGDNYNIEDASAAVVYLDSPILQLCDIVDLPGFGTGDREMDDVLAQKSKDFADIIVYMSPANGFLRGTDIEFLKASVNSLPAFENEQNKLKPLDNLFVVASQAHTVNHGNARDLELILNAGAARFYREVPEEIWENKTEISGYYYKELDIRKRFFSYTTDKPQLRESFEKELKNLLEFLPSIINKKAIAIIDNFLDEKKIGLKKEIASYQNIIQERESFIHQLKEMKKNEPNRKNETHKARMEVIDKISEFRSESLSKFEDDFASVISVDSIIDIIKSKGYKKKKADMESLAGFLSSKLQARMQNVLKGKSEELNKIIDKYLEDFEGAIKKHGNAHLGGFEIPFDSVKVFAGGLAGLATFGGLAFWASTLGNLGGYILVAKGVSILSALGISVGGTASAATAVSAIGGPITLAIALAVVVGIGVFMFASGGWQKSVAKKIVKEYAKQDALEQFTKEIDKFWDETEDAYNSAADHLEEEWQNKLKEMDEKVSSYSIEDLKKSIANAEGMIDFLERMPLLPEKQPMA